MSHFMTLREALLKAGFDHSCGVVCLQWTVDFKKATHKEDCDNKDELDWCDCPSRELVVKRIIPWVGKWQSKLLDTNTHCMSGSMSWGVIEDDRIPPERERSIELDFMAEDPKAVYTLGSYDGSQWIQKVPKKAGDFIQMSESLGDLVLSTWEYDQDED